MKSLTYAHNICTSTNPYKLYVQMMSLLYKDTCKFENGIKINDMMQAIGDAEVPYFCKNTDYIESTLKKFCNLFTDLIRSYIKYDDDLYIGNEIEINVIDNIKYSENKRFGFEKISIEDAIEYLNNLAGSLTI